MPKNTPTRLIDERRSAADVIFGGGGGGGAGVSDHGLLDGLNDDDHLHYLTAGRGNALYVPLVRQVLGGAGMTGGGDLSVDRTLNVGAGTLITVNADAVSLSNGTAQYQVPVTGATPFSPAYTALSAFAGNGLSFTGGKYVVGTTGLGLDTTSTQVRLTSSSDVGTTPAAAILASTSAGGLTLGTLTVRGSLDVLAGGDLTVTGSGAYAGLQVLFVDSSGGNVGINRAPDPQFALDIAGPARADYFIGPHAIQLRDVSLLAHFDGRTPYETNFSGDPNGHMGQVGAAAGSVIFRPGKFYKAAQFAEATTNLVPNPSFEVDAAGWGLNNGSGTATLNVATDRVLYGTKSLGLTSSTSNAEDFAYLNVTGLAASTAYTVSVWVNVPTFYGGAISNRGLLVYDTADAAGGAVATITATTAGWVRLAVTITTTAAAGSHTIQIRLYAPNGTAYWDAVQCEAKTYMTPYCDGSLGGYSSAGVPDGTGHAWTGTAHASTSTRAAALLTYPTAGNISASVWTIMAWVRVSAVTGGNQHILRINGTTAGNIILRLDATGKPQAYAGTGAAVAAASAVPVATWTHLAATYDGATLRLYVNGVQAASAARSGFSGMPANMYIGRGVAASEWLNGYVDDLCLLPYAADAGLIRSVYESNAPVFAESSVYVFRATAKGLVWGDDEGLWVRNTVGDPVFGIYAGEAATKSWAGQTLAPGDIMWGRGSNYAMWDDSAASMVFVGNGAGLTAINGGNITTGTVTADKLNVVSLSAINANLGAVTAGQIVVGSTNKLWLNDSADGALAIGGTVKASAPFRVAANGELTLGIGGATGQTRADNTGLFIDAQSAFNINYGYKFRYGGSTMGAGLVADYSAGTRGQMWLLNNTTSDGTIVDSSADSALEIRGTAGSAKTSQINLRTERIVSGSAKFTGLSLLNTSAARKATVHADSFVLSPEAGGEYTIWHANNDGPDSGLNADTVDGKHASDFAWVGNNNTFSYETTFVGATNFGSYLRLSPLASAPAYQAGYALIFLLDAGSNSYQLRAKIRSADSLKQIDAQLATT